MKQIQSYRRALRDLRLNVARAPGNDEEPDAVDSKKKKKKGGGKGKKDEE